MPSATLDKLDDVLDIAAGVILDHGDLVGTTRIERLARYLALNLGCEPDTLKSAEAALAVTIGEKLDATTARTMAVALLRFAETVE